MANIEHFGGSLIIHLNCKDKSETTIKKKPNGLLRIASCSLYRKPDISMQSFDLFLKQVHYSITLRGSGFKTSNAHKVSFVFYSSNFCLIVSYNFSFCEGLGIWVFVKSYKFLFSGS